MPTVLPRDFRVLGRSDLLSRRRHVRVFRATADIAVRRAGDLAHRSRILAYNVYFWLAWLLNGIFTERLLRQRGTPISLARLGGVTMIMLPLLQWNRDVIQLVPVWGVLWVWSCFLTLSISRTMKAGIELGLAAGMTSLMCMHYGLFVAILSAVGVWVLIRDWTHWKTWKAWSTGALVGAFLAGPMIWKVHSVLSELQTQRPEALVQNLSLHLGDYTAAWGHNVIPWGTMAARVHWQTSPGWLKCAVAALGLLVGLVHRRSRRWVLFLGLTAGTALALSLGKNLGNNGWSVWDQLCRVVPGLSQVRSPYRFANFYQMAVVLLAFELLRLGAFMIVLTGFDWQSGGLPRFATGPVGIWEES